jgi:hypothetical protein
MLLLLLTNIYTRRIALHCMRVKNRHRWTGRFEAHLWDKQYCLPAPAPAPAPSTARRKAGKVRVYYCLPYCLTWACMRTKLGKGCWGLFQAFYTRLAF